MADSVAGRGEDRGYFLLLGLFRTNALGPFHLICLSSVPFGFSLFLVAASSSALEGPHTSYACPSLCRTSYLVAQGLHPNVFWATEPFFRVIPCLAWRLTAHFFPLENHIWYHLVFFLPFLPLRFLFLKVTDLFGCSKRMLRYLQPFQSNNKV